MPDNKDKWLKQLLWIYRAILGIIAFMVTSFFLFIVIYAVDWPSDDASIVANTRAKEEVQAAPKQEEIVDGIHVATGLKAGEGLDVVIANCTACHSAKLITQNRADKKGWKNMIVWMQETQNLWNLGANEEVIVNYLAKNYAPEKKGRRAPLTNIEWYELED